MLGQLSLGLGVLLLSTGCESVKSVMGFDHQGPDEFEVVPLAPLSLPQDYDKGPKTKSPQSSALSSVQLDPPTQVQKTETHGSTALVSKTVQKTKPNVSETEIQSMDPAYQVEEKAQEILLKTSPEGSVMPENSPSIFQKIDQASAEKKTVLGEADWQAQRPVAKKQQVKESVQANAPGLPMGPSQATLMQPKPNQLPEASKVLEEEDSSACAVELQHDAQWAPVSKKKIQRSLEQAQKAETEGETHPGAQEDNVPINPVVTVLEEPFVDSLPPTPRPNAMGTVEFSAPATSKKKTSASAKKRPRKRAGKKTIKRGSKRRSVARKSVRRRTTKRPLRQRTV